MRPVNYSAKWDAIRLVEIDPSLQEAEAVELQVRPDTAEIPRGKLEQVGTKLSVPLGTVRQVLARIRVRCLPPARELSPGIQESVAWRAESVGGSLPDFVLLELFQRPGQDGETPAAGSLVHTFEEWRRVLREVPDRPVA